MRNIETDLLPMCSVPEEDAQLFIEWMTPERRKETNFDKAVLGYPRACMARVKQSEKTIAMVPMHPILMFESLSHSPELTDSQLVLAFRSIDEKIQQAMQDTGMAEAYFQTNSERFSYLCDRHGWEIVLFDPIKKEWLLKKRARVDWAKLVENTNASNNKPCSES